MSDSRAFSLVLGGGGLKGLAHVGVLRALEERGLAPGAIVGTSIGSLVAAGYAAGEPVDALWERALLVERKHVFQIAHMDMAFRRMLSPAVYRKEPLDTLIRTQYPRDHLSVIGFAYYAREISPGALAELTWHGYEYGTNLQHGLLLARRILAREAAANKEIVVITDGEPTAHFEGGQVEFSYPPTRQTITETLREVRRCTKDGITINTFMLERSRALAEFVAHMTRLNRGRAFYATPERLGEYVLVDFVGRRSKRVS